MSPPNSNFFAFTVLPLAISTPLHTTFLLLKAVLEVRFCQLDQNLRRFCFNRFYTFEFCRHRIGFHWGHSLGLGEVNRKDHWSLWGLMIVEIMGSLGSIGS
ncbi:hypothetical protein NQ318_014352 [Aromia moschata]|uniref:Uncharacterized protein n=1 Tax=Aromia moschata TaxID=1265417 RepID=A0AAV8YZA1_9CUCU|nr:hypothetical protein NQ318_014352 [Aromia moschata]